MQNAKDSFCIHMVLQCGLLVQNAKCSNVYEKWFEGILFLVVFAPSGGLKGQQYILIVHALNKHICKQTSLDVRPPMPLKRGRFKRAYLFA